MGNSIVYAKFGTNATYLQVACLIYGAVCTMLLDELPNGLYYVDELLTRTDSGYGSYLSYYMTDFVKGTNAVPEGTLLQRMRRVLE
ncbi:hypothetical protein ACFO9Q_03415 [Paenibacillus sp. GCM10023252]|uniref:hypothetical protein n=1 Tax=Paenibacillus sp. GCM10023252 TaxID=3252649 RepID=UPI00361DF4F7